MRIVFMGSADFGVPTLARIIAEHTLCAVVSTPPRPQGRGLKLLESPIVSYARSRQVQEILTPADLKSPELHGALSACNADLFVVVAFRILPKTLFSIPRLGTLNVHASLLPEFRGPAPIQRAIEAGKGTGVTVFSIDEGVDTGGILLQEKTMIGPIETTPELYGRLSVLGADALINAVNGLMRGDLSPVPQDTTFTSRAPKLTKAEGLIDWSQSAETIFNKIRAFKPFPGSFSGLDGKRIEIIRATPLGGISDRAPGEISHIDVNFFDVACGAGGLLRVHEVKPEGRKCLSVHDFLLGTKLKEGSRLTWTPVN